MASEYYKKKFEDVKPDEPLELTKKEKWTNWWDYHWFHVLIAILAVVIVAVVVRDLVFRVRPDYRVAYIGNYYMNTDIDALEQSLAQFGEDINGDGRVLVEIQSYCTNENSVDHEANMVALTGDLGAGGSSIYILEDSQWFLSTYKVASEDYCYRWSDCPSLQQIDLGGEYDIALRSDIFYEVSEKEREAITFWEAMTAGAEKR